MVESMYFGLVLSVNAEQAKTTPKKRQTLLVSYEKSVNSEAAVLVGRLAGSTERMARTEWRPKPTMSDGEDGEMTGKGVR